MVFLPQSAVSQMCGGPESLLVSSNNNDYHNVNCCTTVVRVLAESMEQDHACHRNDLFESAIHYI